MLKKFKKRLFVSVLAMMMVFNPVWPGVVFAEEAPPAETPLVVAESTNVTQETPPAETPPLLDTTVETGDTEALSGIDNSVNASEENLPGEISTPGDSCVPPEGETECPGGIAVSHDNAADVDNEATSSAETGDNTIEEASDASIDTGGAAAGVDIGNQVNQNTTNLAAGEGADSSGIEGSSEDNGLKEGEPELTVQNNNSGELDNTASASAETGDNSASNNSGDVVINTGNALAWVNLLNFLNTNIVGSSFEFVFLDLLESQILETNGEVNLNEVWRKILSQKGNSGLEAVAESEFAQVELLIQNFNQAVLENNVEVTAETGGNEANGNQSTTVSTGDAAALANIINFVNTNILGSEFLFFVINILDVFNGNLILPRAENFTGSQDGTLGSGETYNSAFFANQNSAEIDNQLASTADTGGNQALGNQGDSQINTGDAVAIANSLTFANWTIWANDWLILIINVLGGWTGNILGWSLPSAVEEAGGGNQTLEAGQGSPTLPGGQGSGGLTVFENQNQALVKNNIFTSASTGNNQANGNQIGASITTGNALSIANLLNFVNLNIMGGRWMLGVINVIGDWTGNLVFAYPDVTVGLTNGSGWANVGETTTYTLNYLNQGYDLATDVWVTFELPQGFNYLGDSSGLVPSISGQTYSWFIGSLERGEEGGFTIDVQVRPDFSFSESLSFWDKIIPQAHAAETGQEKEVMAAALIGTNDPESNTNNNIASVKTLIYSVEKSEEEADGESGVDQGQPILEVTAKNNVNQFVYPGDIVTFEITISNKGGVVADNVYLIQKLYNGLPDKDFGTVNLKVGRIESGKGVKINFGLKLVNNQLIKAGSYHTIAWAEGEAPNGNLVTSNQARTDFNIKSKNSGSLLQTEAIAKEEGEVLGDIRNACEENQPENILPYVLLFLLSSLWLVEKSRRWTQAWKS